MKIVPLEDNLKKDQRKEICQMAMSGGVQEREPNTQTKHCSAMREK